MPGTKGCGKLSRIQGDSPQWIVALAHSGLRGTHRLYDGMNPNRNDTLYFVGLTPA
jgi:hypothetical protein